MRCQTEATSSGQHIVIKLFFNIEPGHKSHICDSYKSQLCCDCVAVTILLYLEGLRKQFALQNDCEVVGPGMVFVQCQL